MDGHRVISYLAPALGALGVAFVLLDVFQTVLYARTGTSVWARYMAAATWRSFRAVALRLGPAARGTLLSYCGPIILVLLVITWVLGLTLGMALVIWPYLGTSYRATSGPTPTDFWTALYVAGDSITTVGASDLAPATPFFRGLYTFGSIVGISMITLTLTYFLQVYNSLRSRNTLALKLHLATSETGDAAELVAGVGPRGQFDTGYAHLAEIAAELTAFKESHHFYPVIFYFRFREEHYAVSRLALLALDAIALVHAALDDRRYRWLKESAAVNQIERATLLLLDLLEGAFLPKRFEREPAPPDPATADRWRRRFTAALDRLRDAGIETTADARAAADAYVARRARWDACIGAFGRYMAHDLAEIDPATHRLEKPHAHPEESPRLRSAG